MRTGQRHLSLLCLLVLGGGCAPVGRYFASRGGDLSDAVQFALGGPAVGAHVEATFLLNGGLDLWKAYGDQGGTLGNFRGRVPGFGEFAAYSILLFHARGVDSDPLERDPDDAGDFPPVHAGFPTHAHELGRAFEETPAPENLRLLRWLDVEVNAAAILGVRVRFSPGELVDFLVGWFGLDPGGDDLRGDDLRGDASREAPVEAEPVAPPENR